MTALMRTLAVAAALAGASPALATFTLNNDNGGDGSVVVNPLDPRIFTIFGADNSDGEVIFSNLTTYGTVAPAARQVSVRWSYLTNDESANWDPAGWFLMRIPTIPAVYSDLKPATIPR